MGRSGTIALVSLATLALTAENAYGYLDPGSGSFILQAIVAALLGSALALRVFWGKFRAFFIRRFSRSDAVEKKRD